MTYEYTCKNCKHEWEEDQPITAEPVELCPKCKQKTAKRLISKGTGFVLKGTGWYKTGY